MEHLLEVEQQAESFFLKIKHHLMTNMAVSLAEASQEQFYRAFSLALKEQIMINWVATERTFKRDKCRKLYYLCLEYLPGRFISNNIINMQGLDLVKAVLKKANRSMDVLIRSEKDPGLGNGGLGRLASCFLDSLATQFYPAMGYGLRYQYGIFDQQIHQGAQIEKPDPWLLNENPWEFRRDDHSFSVHYGGDLVTYINKKGVEAYGLTNFEEVRALAYDYPIIGYSSKQNFNVLTLRLWTTKESPRNFALQRFNAGLLDQATENVTLTDVLYPNDHHEMGKRVRLKQEFLLASASIKDIVNNHLAVYPDMTSFGDKVRIQINDTHPVLAIAELMRILIKYYDFSWGESWETVQQCFSYTNHTVLKEALEEWDEKRLSHLLPRQYKMIQKLNYDFCESIRRFYPNNEDKVRSLSVIENGQIRMAHLAIYMSHKVNGVASLHTEILKKSLFSSFCDLYPHKFLNVTNGVTPRRWILEINPLLADFIIKRIGSKWITDFKDIERLREFAKDKQTQEELIKIKKMNKQKLMVHFRDEDPIRDRFGQAIGHFELLGEEALYDVQIKRIHEYKRQLMNALHVIMIYQELKKNPDSRQVKRMVIFAGKAAPGYKMAKNIIQLIHCIASRINQDSEVNHKLRVAFLENYSVSKASLIIPAADLSEQISKAGLEASGTGNMKMAMNGALTIGTEDGANIDMRLAVGDAWWPFAFGAKAEENTLMDKEKSYSPLDIYLKNIKIREALEALNNGQFTSSKEEEEALGEIYLSLLDHSQGRRADFYQVLNDLQSYFDTQQKVEKLFSEPYRWAEYVLHNIAGMGDFSSDSAIHKYAEYIWKINKHPVDELELSRVRTEYEEHDRCRIF
ncbi:MAG: glycogen/starch/alpha-glucan family phosphorylase [Rhabdochlamydiaceae bacterium]